MEPLQVGDPELVGRYRLLGRLGAGGMGRVYLGVTPEGGQAAVKVIRDDLAEDTGFRQRFRREVAAASAVAGMFTARMLDADPEAEPPWLATEYVEGPSLRDAVLLDGPLPEARVVALAQGLAEALAAIHAAGLTHRDLKPANVLLSPGGPRVIDFGIARAAGSTQLTATGQLIGTPDFMAPEQIDGTLECGPPADLFALGSTLVHAATGRGPFASEQTSSTLYRVLHAAPDLRGVPARVLAIVGPCLEKDPSRRPTAVQLAVHLRSGPVPGGREAETIAPQDAPAGRRRRVGLLVAVAVVLVAAVGATAFALVDRDPTEPTPIITTTTAPVVAIDPNSPQARYVDRLCASGELLVALGDTATAPAVTGDPAQAKRDFLAGLDRTIGTVDAALPDYIALRDDAPNDQVRTQFGLIVREFTSARTAFVDARSQVAASEPLEIAVYRKAINRFTDGTRNLALAVPLVQDITLPREYTDASAVAPRCAK